MSLGWSPIDAFGHVYLRGWACLSSSVRRSKRRTEVILDIKFFPGGPPIGLLLGRAKAAPGGGKQA